MNDNEAVKRIAKIKRDIKSYTAMLALTTSKSHARVISDEINALYKEFRELTGEPAIDDMDTPAFGMPPYNDSGLAS